MGKSTLPKVIHVLGTPQTASTSNFTAPCDGIYFVQIFPSSSTTIAYAYFVGGDTGIDMRIQGLNGVQSSSCCPVNKGVNITRSAASNCSIKAYFIPFV